MNQISLPLANLSNCFLSPGLERRVEYFFIRIFRSSASDMVDEAADIWDTIQFIITSRVPTLTYTRYIKSNYTRIRLMDHLIMVQFGYWFRL